MRRRFSRLRGWPALAVILTTLLGVFVWLAKPLDVWQWASELGFPQQDTISSTATELGDWVKDVVDAGLDEVSELIPSSSPRGNAGKIQSQDTPPAMEQLLAGRVVRVGDGDTLDLRAGRKEIRVRLHQIDTPELDQPWGRKAKRALSRKVKGRTVQLQVNTVDDYGRLVATVWLGERDINRELVAEGHAWVFRRYLEDQTLLADEAAAKAAGLGVWGTDNPMPPWQWRRRR